MGFAGPPAHGRRPPAEDTSSRRTASQGASSHEGASFPGQTPPPELEQALRQKALRLLALRDRTRAELRQRLGRGAPEAVVERVLAWLEGLGYVDDRRFAQQWVRERRAGSGPRKLAFELQQKGLDSQLIREELGRWTDPEQTYQAAVNVVRARVGRLRLTGGTGDEPDALRRRLMGLLARRGFDFEVARQAVNQVLAEEGLAQPGGPPEPWSHGG